MQAHIPAWAYPSKPIGWVRFGRPHFSDREVSAEWTGRVPVWVASTAHPSRLQPETDVRRELNLLIVRVLPEIEVVIASEVPIDPDKIAHAIQRRTPQRKWPVRKWRLNHLVHVSPRTDIVRREGVRTVRPCGGRVPTRKEKMRFLSWIGFFGLPVSIVTNAGKSTE